MFERKLLSVLVGLMGVNASLTYAQANDLLEEIVIVGVQRAELNARDAERSKNIFSSVISQDDAGNFADQNVAESLQRLPGVTLQRSEGEGRFVTVRGLGPNFVAVSMNNVELASASSDTREFALDAVPADLLSAIEVFKTLTPDMDLNSIGGRVNVKTLSAFDRKKDSFRIGAQASYQDYSEEVSPKVFLQGTNVLADGTLGVGYSLSYEKRATEVYEVRHHDTDLPRYLQKRLTGDPLPASNAPRILAPWQFELREEQAERTRLAGSIDLNWRPNDDSEYFLRVSHTSFEDEDIALREFYRTDPAVVAESEIAYVDAASRTFGVIDAELQHQFFTQKGTADTTVFAVGGENVLSDAWTLDYSYTRSVGEYSKPDGKRVQFRLQDLPMVVNFGANNYSARILSPDDLAEMAGVDVDDFNSSRIQGWDDYIVGQRKQSNMVYDNLFIEDSFREDTLDQFSLNLLREFNGGVVNYVKTGIAVKQRDRDRNKDRWSIAPGTDAFPDACGVAPNVDSLCADLRDSTLDDFATHRPNHSGFNYDFITEQAANDLLNATYQIAKYTDPLLIGQESTKDDYLFSEDTAAAYIMAEFQLSEKASLITGVRYEQTEVNSSGYFSVRNDRFAGTQAQNSSLDVAIPVASAETSYSDLFPSIHFNYDASDNVQVRSSLWTSFARPSFGQTRAFAEIVGRVSLCNPDTAVCTDNPPTNGGSLNSSGQIVTADGDIFTLANNVNLRLGNPDLEAMTATNFDASISWFGDVGDFAQVAFFYKDIKDFIVQVGGARLGVDQLPFSLPIDQINAFSVAQNFEFTNVNYAINGDKAEVYGVELSYSKYFDNDYFVQSNITLMKSDAEVGDSIREGSIRLPDQADASANLTLGWENDYLTLRLIGNYRSKILSRIGNCSSDDIALDLANANGGTVYPEACKKWADVYQAARFGLDFKATYDVTDDLRVSFDAINLNNQKDRQYFEGNEYSNGNILFVSEDYGRAYQLGLLYSFR